MHLALALGHNELNRTGVMVCTKATSMCTPLPRQSIVQILNRVLVEQKVIHLKSGHYIH